MTPQEAQSILETIRLDRPPPDDPAVAAALALAARDPALGAWLQEARRLDGEMGAALGALQPPPDLKSSLLALAPPREDRRNFTTRLLALAAALALGVGVLWRQRETDPRDDLSAVAQRVLAEGPRLGLESPTVQPLREWLTAQDSPWPDALPPGLVGRKSLGCQTYEQDGRRVSLVCFWLDAERVVHLFTTGNPARRSSAPVSGEMSRQPFVRWSDLERHYLLAGVVPIAELRALL